jgi:large subunit ribosomal protein L22
MAQYGYSIKDMNETRARAVMRDVPISYKVACMIGKRIKGMEAQRAINFLRNVQTLKVAVPYTKFNDSVGHKPGIGPGRYPIKAAKLFEQLIANAVANADDKGLGKDVMIEFVVSQQASLPYHNGRQGRRQFKRSHVELVVTNAGVPDEKRAPKAAAKKAPAKKAEATH